MIEISFDIDYRRVLDADIVKSVEWLAEELETFPKKLHDQILDGENNLPMNFPGGLEF